MPALGYTFDKLFWFDRIEASTSDPGTVRVWGSHMQNPYTGSIEDNNGKVLSIGPDRAVKWRPLDDYPPHERFAYDKVRGTIANHPDGIPTNHVNVLFIVDVVP